MHHLQTTGTQGHRNMGSQYPQQGMFFADSHIDPFLKSVSKIILANGMCQSSEGWLEFCDGGWQVFEPAAQLGFFFQDCHAFT